MPPQRRSKFPDVEWEAHKATIARLFLQEKRKLGGNDGVKEFMKRNHQFDASISQYEARFKKWSFRKKLCKVDWVAIGLILAERERQGMQSEVWIFGERIQNIKVRKELSRYRDDVAKNTQIDARHEELPPGVIIREPCDFVEDASLSMNSNNDMLLAIGKHVINNGGEHSSAFKGDRLVGNGPLPADDGALPSNAPESSASLEAFSLHDPPRERTLMCIANSPNLPSLCMDLDRHFPLLDAQQDLLEKIRLHTPMDELALLRLDILPSDISQNLYALSGLHIRGAGKYMATLRSVLPSRISAHLTATTQSMAVLQIAVYELVNKCYMVSDKDATDSNISQPVTWILSRLQKSSQPIIRTFCQCIPKPYSEALILNLFDSALHIEAFRVVEAILRASSKAGSLIRSQAVRKGLSALVKLVFHSDEPGLIRLVIELADESVKSAVRCSYGYFWSNVYERRGCSQKPTPTGTQAMKRLLQEPHHTSRILVQQVIDSGDIEVIQTMINCAPALQAQTYHTWILQYHFLEYAASALDEQLLSWSFRTLLRQVPLMHLRCSKLPNSHGDSDACCTLMLSRLSESLKTVVDRNFPSVVEILLEAGAHPSPRCLLAAVRSNDIALIRRLIAAGASPFRLSVPPDDSPPPPIPQLPLQPLSSPLYFSSSTRPPLSWKSKESDFEYLTPYAEALRRRFTEAVEAFDSTPREALTTRSRLSIVVAAAEIGDLEILERNLEANKDEVDVEDEVQNHGLRHQFWPVDALEEALKRATANEHRNIILKLLRTGVRPSNNLFEKAILSHDSVVIDLILESGFISKCVKGVIDAFRFQDADFLYPILDCIDFTMVEDPSYVLIKAIKYGDIRLIKYLIHTGIPLGYKTRTGILLGYKINNFGRKGSRTKRSRSAASCYPLLAAIRSGDTEIIRLFVDAGADIDHRQSNGPSPLETALAVENYELIDELLHRGAEPYDSGAMIVLIRRNDIVMIEKLLAAAEKRFPRSAGALLNPALNETLRSGNVRLFRLLAPHCDFTGGPKTINRYRVSMGSLPLAFVLASYQSLPLDALRQVLEAGCDPEVIVSIPKYIHVGVLSTQQGTALHYAVALNSIPWIDVLIEYGANVNRPATVAITRTPLQLASEMGRLDMVTHLLRKGADVNASPGPVRGGTALQLAAAKGFVGIAELLIKNDADVNASAGRMHGRTAFEIATEWGRLDMMLLLVRKGADLISPEGEKQYQRAIEFAEKSGEEPAKKLAQELYDIALKASLDVMAPVVNLDF